MQGEWEEQGDCREISWYSCSKTLSAERTWLEHDILDKRDDWDEEGAIGCSALIYARATNLLRFYSVEIKKQYKIAIEVPEINLARDGSIDLEWRTDKVIFLMNVLNQASYEVHYYGEDLESNTIIKGIIKNSILNNDLVFWMKKLNKYGWSWTY